MYEGNSKFSRQTSIEWLRIISMIMIVLGHSVIHGGFEQLPVTGNGLIAIAMTQGARIGVNVFVIITGYFSVGKNISLQKIKHHYSSI